ncbi:MAG: GNAT family N-acetyltransferase [Leptolyngbyaceae cyanobacterium]
MGSPAKFMMLKSTGLIDGKAMLHTQEITASDSDTIARVHALSWQDSYRGILRDSYLDGPIFEERLALWEKRLLEPASGDMGFLALSETIPVGFIFACAGHDIHRGTFLDNLHVLPEERGKGIGKKLLRALTSSLISKGYEEGIYLWVFEDNYRTRKFYERLGANVIERVVIDAPGGGKVAEWLYAWESLNHLHTALAD